MHLWTAAAGMGNICKHLCSCTGKRAVSPNKSKQWKLQLLTEIAVLAERNLFCFVQVKIKSYQHIPNQPLFVNVFFSEVTQLRLFKTPSTGFHPHTKCSNPSEGLSPAHCQLTAATCAAHAPQIGSGELTFQQPPSRQPEYQTQRAERLMGRTWPQNFMIIYSLLICFWAQKKTWKPQETLISIKLPLNCKPDLKAKLSATTEHLQCTKYRVTASL